MTSKKIQGYEIHPAAELFPMMGQAELQKLAEDIKERGQLEPIELYDGRVLDGRNRLKACELAGVEPWTVPISVCMNNEHKGDPIGWVLAKNLHRRHLTTSQAAMVAAKAREMYEAEAKERKKRKGKSVVEKLPPQNGKGKSRDEAGKALRVSGKTVDAATKVRKRGAPEVVEAVERGQLSVHAAAELVDAVPEVEQQAAAVKGGRKAVKAAAKKVHPPLCRECEIRDATGDLDGLCDQCRCKTPAMPAAPAVSEIQAAKVEARQVEWVKAELAKLWERFNAKFDGAAWCYFCCAWEEFDEGMTRGGNRCH